MKKPKTPVYTQFSSIQGYVEAFDNYVRAARKYIYWKNCNRINKGLKPK